MAFLRLFSWTLALAAAAADATLALITGLAATVAVVVDGLAVLRVSVVFLGGTVVLTEIVS